MIRMAYLDNIPLRKALEKDYLGRMDVVELNRKWREAKISYPDLAPLIYSVKQLLTSPFGILLQISKVYEKVMNGIGSKDRREEIYTHLRKKVFAYKGKHHNDMIAPFFMDHAEELRLYTCHYCDMAFINIFSYTERKSGQKKTQSQFELDHVISQKECPLLALSMYNFVPSCPVCNGRIKHQKGIASSKKLMKKFSPTSQDFAFDSKVNIILEPKEGTVTPYMEHQDKYNIVFDCNKDNDYKEYVDNLLLTERYNCHKVEALRLKDLQLYYPDSHIWGISNLLGRPFGEIKEDIFGLRFTRDEHRLFKKLRRDMMSNRNG